MADRAVLAKPAGDQQVAQASGESQAKGGLADFASSVWSKTKEVAQSAKPYGEKALDAAKDVVHAAKPMGEKALEGAKDAGQKAQKFGKESGLTEDVTEIAKKTGKEYQRDGGRVYQQAKDGNYAGAAWGAAKLGAKAHLGPLEIIGEKAPELIDRQAGRHLNRDQAQQVHSATELARKGTQIGKVISGGPSGLADAAMDQAKKSAKQEILNNPEQVPQTASNLADKAKGLFNDLRKRMPSGSTQPPEQSQH